MNAIEGGSLRDPTLEPILSLLCFAGWFPQSLLKHESFIFREGHWSGRVGKRFMFRGRRDSESRTPGRKTRSWESRPKGIVGEMSSYSIVLYIWGLRLGPEGAK